MFALYNNASASRPMRMKAVPLARNNHYLQAILFKSLSQRLFPRSLFVKISNHSFSCPFPYLRFLPRTVTGIKNWLQWLPKTIALHPQARRPGHGSPHRKAIDPSQNPRKKLRNSGRNAGDRAISRVPPEAGTDCEINTPGCKSKWPKMKIECIISRSRWLNYPTNSLHPHVESSPSPKEMTSITVTVLLGLATLSNRETVLKGPPPQDSLPKWLTPCSLFNRFPLKLPNVPVCGKL